MDSTRRVEGLTGRVEIRRGVSRIRLAGTDRHCTGETMLCVTMELQVQGMQMQMQLTGVYGCNVGHVMGVHEFRRRMAGRR